MGSCLISRPNYKSTRDSTSFISSSSYTINCDAGNTNWTVVSGGGSFYFKGSINVSYSSDGYIGIVGCIDYRNKGYGSSNVTTLCNSTPAVIDSRYLNKTTKHVNLMFLQGIWGSSNYLIPCYCYFSYTSSNLNLFLNMDGSTNHIIYWIPYTILKLN